MSWDLYALVLPAAMTNVSELPHGYDPPPLGSRAELRERITEAAPTATFSDPGWGNLRGPGYAIEINLGDDEPVSVVALHVRGTDEAVGAVAALLDRLGLRAIDTGSATGALFSAADGGEHLAAWRAYRDQVLPPPT